MTKKTVKYILMFLGILILLAAYFLFYLDYTEKTDAVNKEISAQSQKLEQLSGYHANIPAYKSSIEENKSVINEALSKYYSVETPEDFIMFSTDMEGTLGLDITTLSFSQPELFFSISGVKENGDYTVPVDALLLTGYKISSTIDGSMNYAQMKSALDFIYSQKDVTKLDSVTMNYDSSTGLILGSFVVDKYFITGRDIQEHQAVVPYTDLGKSVLIGS